MIEKNIACLHVFAIKLSIQKSMFIIVHPGFIISNSQPQPRAHGRPQTLRENSSWPRRYCPEGLYRQLGRSSPSGYHGKT